VLRDDVLDVVVSGCLPPGGRRETAWHSKPESWEENAAAQADEAEAQPRSDASE